LGSGANDHPGEVLSEQSTSGEPRPPLATRRITYRPDVLVVAVAGEVDLGTAPLLDQALRGDLPAVLVVDLSEVTFLGAAGLRVLTETALRAGEQQCRLGLVADDQLALLMLRTKGAAAAIPTFSTLSDAVLQLVS
jgi:anti-anti-sigma factor